MATIQNYEPDKFVAGSTVQWTKSIADRAPEDGWVLSYGFVNADGQFSATGTDNGDGLHLVTISAATSANITVGDYRWQSYVTQGAERFTIATGSIEVLADFATQTVLDARSHVKQTLDALEAVLVGKASKDQLSYSIQNRSLSRMTPSELIQWRDVYRREYNLQLRAEKLQKGQGPDNKVLVRFRGFI